MTLPVFGPFSKLCPSLAGSILMLAAVSTAEAQTPPETLRIAVEPAEPGIRSITLNKKYRPIIGRDDASVTIDTLGSGTELPPCNVSLEVTLHNSRVLHRDADICSGGTLVIDVANDGKPGAARIVGGPSGIVSSPAPAANAAPETASPAKQAQADAEPKSSIETPEPATETADQDPLQSGSDPLLKPLEKVEIDQIDANGGTPTISALPQTQSGYLVAPSDQRVWTTQTGFGASERADLIHGVPDTEDADFRAACRPQSGQATIVFAQTSPSTQEGITQTVQIRAGDFSADYTTIGGSTQNQFGQSFPQLVLPITDPLWQALIAQSDMTVQIPDIEPYTVSLRGSAQPVRLFAATCTEQQTIIGEGSSDTPQIVADHGDVSCGEAGRVRSLDGIRPGQIVFRNSSRETVDVLWIDYNGGERAYARVEPGQVLDQQTYVSHAWIVRGNRGQCLGIYVNRTPYREVNITGGQVFAPQQPEFNTQSPGSPVGPVPPGLIDGRAFDGGTPETRINTTVADYLCTDGIDLRVTFSPEGDWATVVEMGHGSVTLPRRGAGPDLHYTENGYVLDGHFQNTTWSRPGLSAVYCSIR